MQQSMPSSLPRPIYQTVLLVAGLAGLLWFLIQIGNVLVLVLLSLIIAAALYPPVAWLKKRHFPSNVSILIFYLLFIAMAGGIAFVAFNAVVSEGRQFIMQLPEYNQRILAWMETLPEPVANLTNFTSDQIASLTQRGFRFLISSLDYVFTLFSGILGALTVLVLSFYLLVNVKHFEKLVLLLIPDSKQEISRRILNQTACRVGRYVRGQLVLMSVVGVIVWLGLSMMGVNYAFLLGVVSFLLEIVPLVGPIVAALVGVLIALAQDPILALWTALFYFGVQQVENYALVPKIMENAVNLNPFWILLAVLAGAAVSGVLGAVLAIPIAVFLHTLISEVYIRGFLGRDPHMAEAPAAES